MSDAQVLAHKRLHPQQVSEPVATEGFPNPCIPCCILAAELLGLLKLLWTQ